MERKMLLRNWNFNTSYVIFYLFVHAPLDPFCPFQYILCYFLSFWAFCGVPVTSISIHPMLFFIVVGGEIKEAIDYFNTSYVIFYLYGYLY